MVDCLEYLTRTVRDTPKLQAQRFGKLITTLLSERSIKIFRICRALQGVFGSGQSISEGKINEVITYHLRWIFCGFLRKVSSRQPRARHGMLRFNRRAFGYDWLCKNYAPKWQNKWDETCHDRTNHQIWQLISTKRDASLSSHYVGILSQQRTSVNTGQPPKERTERVGNKMWFISLLLESKHIFHIKNNAPALARLMGRASKFKQLFVMHQLACSYRSS